MKRTLLLGGSLAAALAAVGCQDTPIAPPAAPAIRTTNLDAQLSLQSTGLGSLTVDGNPITLPSSLRMSDQRFAGAARRAIDPKDYVCPATTPIINWFIARALEIDRPTRLLYFNLAADLVPSLEALLFQTTATPQYFGYNGEYTKTMLKTERDVKRFWDIASADIQLIGMHGTMLLDAKRIAATYEALGIPKAQATFFAGILSQTVAASVASKGGNHPLFTFNAFASSGGGLPDKIVMGDGILEGYEALGFSDVAPQAVYAHEFAHQIQFKRNYFDDALAQAETPEDEPAASRYIELMADAFSAYYLTHKRGGTMNKHRVAQFLEAFFQIGDCAFDNGGHHGTPNQRRAAAKFGFDVADQAHKQGHILTADQFHKLFVAHYPKLIAPDAPKAAPATVAAK